MTLTCTPAYVARPVDEENIAWFDVAMNDSYLVNGVERTAELRHNFDRLFNGEPNF